MAALAPSARALATRSTAGPRSVLPIRPARLSRRAVQAKALLGGDDSKDSKDDRKFITREQEPEEYWSSQAEKSGKSPFQDPLAIIGIVSILFPFVFLAVGIGAGWIDSSGKIPSGFYN